MNSIFQIIFGVFVIGIVIIEINTVIFVLQELTSVEGLSLFRYHSQRALTCYILLMRELMPSDVGIQCLNSSNTYIKEYDDFHSENFMHIIFHYSHSFEDNIKSDMIHYLPVPMLSNEIYHSKVITEQASLKENIVYNVSRLLEKKLSSIKNVYITEFSLFSILLFCTICFVYIYYRSKEKHNNAVTEKKVVNQLCHELRTSFTPIEMYTREMMNKDDLNFEQKQFINNYILTSIKQHKYILVGRLDFEKLLSKDYELKLENVELVKLIKSYITETEQYILLCNKTLKIELVSSVDSLCIQIDKLVVHYILTNILRNSVKYSNSGVIKLFVDIIESKYEKHIIKIEIKDEGIGLSQQSVSILNKRKSSIIHDKRESDSYGLGILFTKNLVSLLQNGKYYIDSCGENLGTTSTIVFNVDSADNIYIQEITANLSNFVIICITDDCPIVRNVMKITLQNAFKRILILEFENGEKLLNYDFNHQYVYIHVLDEHMHSTGGILLGNEVSNILKSRPYETHKTISMSGNDIMTLHHSFDIVWNKPPPPNETIEMQLRELIRPYTSGDMAIDFTT